VAVSATAGGSNGEVMDWCWRDVREVRIATAAKVDGQLYVKADLSQSASQCGHVWDANSS
jgi:hypothetical protein